MALRAFAWRQAGRVSGVELSPDDPYVLGTYGTARLRDGDAREAARLAREVAGITGGRPVITTATDVNRVPAIDLIAEEKLHVVGEEVLPIRHCLVGIGPIANRRRDAISSSTPSRQCGN